jgi:hypothetical protein
VQFLLLHVAMFFYYYLSISSDRWSSQTLAPSMCSEIWIKLLPSHWHWDTAQHYASESTRFGQKERARFGDWRQKDPYSKKFTRQDLAAERSTQPSPTFGLPSMRSIAIACLLATLPHQKDPMGISNTKCKCLVLPRHFLSTKGKSSSLT